MRRIAAAAVLYFAIVFAVGFALGPVRVLWLEPQIGALLAVLVEAPVLVAAMVVAARWIVGRLGTSTEVAPMLGMGLMALALVLLAEFTVGRWLRGLTVPEQVGYLMTPAGLVYVASLVLFALVPVVVNSMLDDDGL